MTNQRDSICICYYTNVDTCVQKAVARAIQMKNISKGIDSSSLDKHKDDNNNTNELQDSRSEAKTDSNETEDLNDD